MSNVIETLLKDGPVITDGAWGTELDNRGLGPGEMPDLWNLSHPDQVESVAQAYVNAGSKVVLTNTFRASRLALGKLLEGKPEEFVRDINVAGVKISKRAAGDKALVFASIGPSGKLLLTKQVTEEQLADSFEEQANALAEGGADALVVETMIDLVEAKIAIGAAKRTGLPVVGSVVFDSGKNKDRTMMGVTPEQAVAELEDCGADIIGANCGIGIENYIPICERYAQTTDLPIWIKANAGMPELVGVEVRYNTTPQEFASHLKTLIAAGASFIGGCCGTSPLFITELVNELR
ncbi:MAG: methionine synthase [Halieaceae bacterium]|nr:methionine synthase [Halieaceae bacterium]